MATYCQPTLMLTAPWAMMHRHAFSQKGWLLLVQRPPNKRPLPATMTPTYIWGIRVKLSNLNGRYKAFHLFDYRASTRKLIYSFNHEPWHIIGIACKYLNANYRTTNRPLCPKQTGAVSGSRQILARRQLCCLCTTNNRCLESVPPPPAPTAPATSLYKGLKAKSYPEWLTYVSLSFKLFSICLATQAKTLYCWNHLPRN